MESFRSIERATREGRAERSQRTVPAGTGHRYCNRHLRRFAIAAGGCPVCSPKPAAPPGSLMPYPRDCRSIQKAHEAENRLANEWLICSKHGGYSPNVRGQFGWTRRECPSAPKLGMKPGTPRPQADIQSRSVMLRSGQRVASDAHRGTYEAAAPIHSSM